MKTQRGARTPLQFIRYTSHQHIPFFVLIGVLLFLSCLAESLIFLFLRYGIDAASTGVTTRHIWGAVLGMLLLYLLHTLFLKGGKLFLCVILARIQAFSRRLVTSILADAENPDQFDPDHATSDVSEGIAAFLHVWVAQLFPALLSLGLYTMLASVFFPLFLGIGIVWFVGHFGLNVLFSKYERKLLNTADTAVGGVSTQTAKFREYAHMGYLILHAPFLFITLTACLVLWQDGDLSPGSVLMMTLLALSFSRRLLNISNTLPETTISYTRLQTGLLLVLLAAKQRQVSEEVINEEISR